MENNNLKNEMETLCNMQIEFWKSLGTALVAIDDTSETEIRAIWYNHFKENNDAVQQLIKVKTAIDKTEN